LKGIAFAEEHAAVDEDSDLPPLRTQPFRDESAYAAAPVCLPAVFKIVAVFLAEDSDQFVS
jgi:hypothetical protein